LVKSTTDRPPLGTIADNIAVIAAGWSPDSIVTGALTIGAGAKLPLSSYGHSTAVARSAATEKLSAAIVPALFRPTRSRMTPEIIQLASSTVFANFK